MVRSFGVVAVPTPGTPVNLAAHLNLADGQGVQLQAVMLQANPANTGKMYIFASMTKPPADHRATGTGLIGWLPGPADPTDGPFPSASWGVPAIPAGINLAQLWIDADVAGNSVAVSGTGW